MLNSETINTFVEKLSKIVPAGLLTCKEEASQSLRAMLEGLFDKLELVTREEFEVQKSVLLKTRLLLSELEKRIAVLESASEKSMHSEH